MTTDVDCTEAERMPAVIIVIASSKTGIGELLTSSDKEQSSPISMASATSNEVELIVNWSNSLAWKVAKSS